MDPPALRNRPVVEQKLLYYRTAFIQLSGSRPYSAGGTPLPIPISEYVAYCELFGIKSQSERERLFKLVRAQDKAYTDRAAEKAREQAENDKKKNRDVARK